MNDKVYQLTPEQAVSCMAIRGGMVHSFVAAGGALLGADCDLDGIKEAMGRIAHPDNIQIAGENAQKMNHAVAVFDTRPYPQGGWRYYESDPAKVAETIAAQDGQKGATHEQL